MGNRILKETILTSPEITALSFFEEAFFYHLIVSVDDDGIISANPLLLAHVLFPWKSNVTLSMVEKTLEHLEALHLISRFEDDKKRAMLKITTWERHQCKKTVRRKYTEPGKAKPEKKEAPESGAKVITAADVLARADRKPAADIMLPLNDGTDFAVTPEYAEELAALYPSLDVPQQLRAMRGWSLSNPEKRKSRFEVLPFINSWLTRVQNRETRKRPPRYSSNPFLEMLGDGKSQ